MKQFRFSISRFYICCFLMLSTLLTGCASFSSKTAILREKFNSGDFAAAEKIVDEGIALETGSNAELVSRTKALDYSINATKGDALLYLLDKGMLRFIQDEPEVALRSFRKARDVFDANFLYSSDDFLKDTASLFVDDGLRVYRGADYEHIMLRAMLAMSDLAAQTGDAYAYAVQLGEKQEEIIGSPFGEIKKNGTVSGYRPREHYSKIALGAYLQGVIREDTLDFDEAAIAYKRAISYAGGDNKLYSAALERVSGGGRSNSGQGSLHIFYFGGKGPNLIESRSNATDDSIRLAGLAAFILSRNFSLLFQGPVPIPMVRVNDKFVPPLSVRVGDKIGTTESVLDINSIAQEQLKANMPWIVARAILRRTVKATSATLAGNAVGRGIGNRLVGDLFSLTTNLISTSLETADTRSWGTLPAAIQAIRMELSSGEHTVYLNESKKVNIRISPGRNSYVFVFQPSIHAIPSVVVDRYSRISMAQ